MYVHCSKGAICCRIVNQNRTFFARYHTYYRSTVNLTQKHLGTKYFGLHCKIHTYYIQGVPEKNVFNRLIQHINGHFSGTPGTTILDMIMHLNTDCIENK